MATYNEISGKLINVTGDKTDPSFDHIVAGTDVIYDSEYPLTVNGYVECDTTPISNPTGNPHEQGWCEEEVIEEEGTGKYILTEDTTVELDKDYYRPIGARQDAINNQLRTTVSDLSGVVLHANEYNEATIHDGDNPQANGWYELSGTTYVLTTDTAVESGKTYYIRVTKITSNEDKIIGKEDGYIPTAGAVGRAMGANFEDNLQSTSTVKGLTANMGRVLNENKADINGYYETMSVGSAKNLDGETINSEAYLIRPTGGESNEVANGVASVLGMEGNSAVWNQIVQNGDFSGGTEIWGNSNTSEINVANNSLILKCTRSSTGVYAFQVLPMITGHKYYFNLWLTSSINTNETRISFGSGTGARIAYESLTANLKEKISHIFTHGDSSSQLRIYLDASVAPSVGDTLKINDVVFIDLTLNGIDNLTTTAQVESWLAKNVGLKPYYGYNAGTILSAQTLGIKTYGQNLLNPTTKQAKLIPYTCEENSNVYTIKNVPSGATATFTPDATGVAESITITNNEFDITNYGSGILELSAATADTYVCMKRDEQKDDDVVPFEEHTQNFDVRKVYGKVSGAGEYVQCFPNGMRSAKSVHDTLTANEAVVKISGVDLGDLNYVKTTSGTYNYFSVHKSILGISNTITNSIVSQIYHIITSNNFGNENYSIGAGTNYINITNSNYKDSTEEQFAEGMVGVELIYELATPITYTDLIYRDGGIDRPLREVLVNLNVDNWSMEEQLMTDYDNQGNPTSVPATIQTKYSIDAVEAIKTLEESSYFESDIHDNLQAMLTCINTNCASVIGGQFSISETATNKLFSFTFTANASTNSTEENTETI